MKRMSIKDSLRSLFGSSCLNTTVEDITMIKCCILFLSAVGLASAGVFQQPELLRTLHTLMNADELSRTFGVDNSSSVDDYEVIYIRRHRVFKFEDPLQSTDDDLTPRKRSGPHDNHAHYSFATKGKNYNLKVKPNKFLMAPNMKTVVRNEKAGEKFMEDRLPAVECHFLHIDGETVAAISHCSDDDIQGYVIDDGKPMEIKPISPRLRQMLRRPADDDDNDFIMVGAHILRPVDPLPHLRAHQAGCATDLPIRMVPRTHKEAVVAEPEVVEKRKGKTDKAKSPSGKSVKGGSSKNGLEKSVTGRQAPNKILELGIFVDSAALALFMPFLGEKEYIKLRELVLAFVNGMQALYHLPSLGQRIDLSIVYMEFHAKAPANLVSNGERGKLLDSFCTFQKALNKPSDADPEHWDMALLLSGLDFYAVEGGKNNYITMGLSTVTGVCSNNYNCVIGEFGVTNQQGAPYPSTGFTSLYVMAHEIGHNLGMSHDSSSNTCTTEGFIMSPSRGVVGETTWSTCSAAYLSSITVTCMNDLPTGKFPDYNHDKYGDKPGQLWSADEQCRILLRDKAAVAFYANNNDLAAICNSMRCRTPNRDGYFSSGPALPGTVCGSSLWCDGGKCVPSGRSAVQRTTTKGGWSDWKSQPCVSGCLVKSKGAAVSERECDNPKPSDVLMRCDGASIKVALCDDAQVCGAGKTRMTPIEFAGQQCAKFNQHVPLIDPKGKGMQAAYSAKRPWQSCAIFCKRSDRDGFYTPRVELNSLTQVSAYFPDGTWCGNDGQKDLFCLQRSCVSQESAEGLIRTGSGPADAKSAGDLDMLLSNAPMTASSSNHKLPAALEEYLMLDKDGKPIKEEIDAETIHAAEINSNSHSGYVDDDFITLKP